MILSRRFLWCIGSTAIVLSAIWQQSVGQPPKARVASEVLKPAPRPKRTELPPSVAPGLQFIPGERIALVGNSTAERMNLFGHFETQLHARFADQKLVVRNFARPADEVRIRQRSADYTKLDDPLYAFNPDTIFCFFGANESYAGPVGVAKYSADYEKFLDEYTSKYPRDDAKSAPRFVLFSPMAFEPTGTPMLPDGTTENANLKLYTEATKQVAQKRKLAFVDLFTPTLPVVSEKPGMQFTINGLHTNEAGDAVLAKVLMEGLFGADANVPQPSAAVLEKLRPAVVDKSWVHSQDYRMVNGWYVYGGRRTFDHETFPLE
ncbi:MAG: SGNH/GDSL hydrolase family protein, partial [Gemmataceae bacterium]